VKRQLFSLGGLVLFLLIWQAIPAAVPDAGGLLPLPSQLPDAFWREASSGIWGACVVASLSHYALGLAVGVLLGVGVGVLTGANEKLEWSLSWIVRIVRPIPGLAWIPFAILWFGVEEKAAVFIIAIGVFWIVYFAAHGAVRNVDKDLLEVADAFGFGGFWAKLLKVQFPASLPAIFVGVRMALGQAWMAVVAAELFRVSGLGQRMNQASSLLATDIVVVYMLTMAGLYGLADAGFVFFQSRSLARKN
jgi:sulfonate transport system permease protein